MRIAYVFRAHPAYARCTKECNSLVRAGHDVTFIGWDLKPQDQRQHEMLPQVDIRLLRLELDYGRFQIIAWLRWYWHLIRTLGFHRFDAVHAVDEYPVVMLLPFKRILFRYLVMDVYDSIIKRPAHNRLVGRIYQGIRWIANRGSDVIIETSEELKQTLGGFSQKAVVLYNSPQDPIEAIRGIWPPENGPVRVAVGGAIGRQRMALEALVEVLDQMGPEQVQVESSGVLLDDYAREVWCKHPCVRHRWLDKTEDYFRQMAECDVVFGMRADADHSTYRGLVFPQKVFDAAAVGRPILVSSENWVAQWLRTHQLGYDCSYRDPKAIRRILEEARQCRRDLPAFSERARRLYKERYDWTAMEKVLACVYKDLKAAPAGQ